MRVAVLCGGKGTRLGEPIKCLTEVAGRPFMDWKIDQLERCGATEIDLLCGPYRREFAARYGSARCWADAQTGISDALGEWDGWWTMGDVLLELPLGGWRNVCYVTFGTQIGGLWLDCGLYHGRGPWQMLTANAKPYTINTPEDREETDAYLRRHCLTG